MSKLTRNYVDTKYGITLTDQQWSVVRQEMTGEPDSDSIAAGFTTFDEVLDEVIENLDEYVADYVWFSQVTGAKLD